MNEYEYEATDEMLADVMLDELVDGGAIRLWRVNAGLTQAALGRLIGYGPAAIQKVETGGKIAKRFLVSLRSIASEMHRLRGLPIGKSLEVTRPGAIPESKIAKSRKHSGHWGNCINPGCKRGLVYFYKSNQRYCSDQCARKVAYLRQTGRFDAPIQYKNKAHKVQCPECGHVFRSRGHGFIEGPDQTRGQAHDEPIQQAQPTGDETLRLLQYDPGVGQPSDEVQDVRDDVRDSNI